MINQQAPPERAATQVVSALPLAFRTRHNAVAAPTHTGSNRMAIIVLHHLGTRRVLKAARSGSRFVVIWAAPRRGAAKTAGRAARGCDLISGKDKAALSARLRAAHSCHPSVGPLTFPDD